MYIEVLEIKGLRLLRDVTLRFRNDEGRLRRWTVLIGRNGTGKTSVLQAIALASVGSRQVNNLAEDVLDHLHDRRAETKRDTEVFAQFSFPETALKEDVFPGLSAPVPATIRLHSDVRLSANGTLLSAVSRYGELPTGVGTHTDPLDAARDQQKKFWFVAGYGPSRHLPPSETQPQLKFPYLDRLKPLFDPTAPITSTGFTNYFGQPEATGGPRSTRANQYARILQEALFHNARLLPDLTGIDLRGRGGTKTTTAFQDSARFQQRAGGTVFNVPAVSLAHGYQSTIAWIADLVGHIVLEANADRGGDAQAELDAQDMSGLVLIDELDLYLHPAWQVVLVRALKETFPRLQFVVTTHSPLVLASLDPKEDQVIHLEQDPETGDVGARVREEDPRLLTASELLKLYFEIDDLHPDPVGRMVHDYRYLASNPYRRDEDDAQLVAWREALKQAGVDPNFEPVPRRPFRRGAA